MNLIFRGFALQIGFCDSYDRLPSNLAVRCSQRRYVCASPVLKVNVARSFVDSPSVHRGVNSDLIQGDPADLINTNLILILPICLLDVVRELRTSFLSNNFDSVGILRLRDRINNCLEFLILELNVIMMFEHFVSMLLLLRFSPHLFQKLMV